MEDDLGVGSVHPVFITLGWVAVLYLIVTGFIAWVAWGYCADEWGRAWWRRGRGLAGRRLSRGVEGAVKEGGSVPRRR